MEPATRTLQASVDDEDDSHFRILVNGDTIRYLTVASGVYTAQDMCFSPTFMSLLPSFPPGDWNEACISRDAGSGEPYFRDCTKRSLPGITSIWHANKVDYLNLKLGAKLRSAVYETAITHLTESVVKFARFDWEIAAVERETAAYHWIEGEGIGPEFQGHVTEHGRVIGFLIAKVTNARHAGPQDLGLCQTVLAKLHGLGIVHGDVNRYNFLIHDGQAILIDFDCARKCEDQTEFKEEQQSMREQLSDESGLGGTIRIAG
ncbi:hypothetical protein LTR56_011460 [Elasticomyces elasticus]|nr:hypothetical protein LTR56_011460 [Elasticomyces elasticus]KAK3655946.1 hypothetical protein LTR22_009955 [Elasticomyces elasticus]KAK4921445.1 hypothetical protein LTR49_011099 [Elasticomyces elasticus]KAK5760083.1 hypothetical protein LTS12_009814 [Elasticomyces elasticus]